MRRFIAGAQCPACQSLDTLYVNSEETLENYQHLYCVRCDYQAKRNQTQGSDPLTGESSADSETEIKWH